MSETKKEIKVETKKEVEDDKNELVIIKLH